MKLHFEKNYSVVEGLMSDVYLVSSGGVVVYRGDAYQSGVSTARENSFHVENVRHARSQLWMLAQWTQGFPRSQSQRAKTFILDGRIQTAKAWNMILNIIFFYFI